MNPFLTIAILTFLQFPGIGIDEREDTINNVFNELEAEGRLVIYRTENYWCWAVDILNAPELNQDVKPEISSFCQKEQISKEQILDKFREGYDDALKLRETVPLDIFF